MLRALTVSLLATALIGGMLYYTFKRYTASNVMRRRVRPRSRRRSP